MSDIPGIEIGRSAFVSSELRVFRNTFIADIYGRTLGYSDLGIAELANIERQVEPFGVVILLDEHSGSDIGLNRSSADFHKPTKAQLEIVEELASLDPKGDDIPWDLQNITESTMKSLYRASVAIVTGKILFKSGSLRYEDVLGYMDENPDSLKPEDQKLFDRGKALEAVSVSPAALMITAAQAAKTVFKSS